jgi:GNAT superfamily N-acetyltransferase
MIDSGAATGVLAYSGGRVVGWCNESMGVAAAAREVPGVPPRDRPRPAASSASSSRRVRGQGLARKLLDGACDLLRDRGLTWVYAYPRRSRGRTRVRITANYRCFDAASRNGRGDQPLRRRP